MTATLTGRRQIVSGGSRGAGKKPGWFRRNLRAFTLTEAIAALGVVGIFSAIVLQILLALNRTAASTRFMNLAKVEAISRIQEALSASYAPEATPPVIPTILAETPNPAPQNIVLGDSTVQGGSIPATVLWTVTTEANGASVPIRRIVCRIDYTFRGRPVSYEMVSFRAPD